MMEFVNQVIGWLFGGAIVVGLMSVIHKRDAVDWDQLVSIYGRDWQTPRPHKRFANMILYSEGRPAKSYKGIVEIGLLDEGIAFRPNRILRPFQPPILIPYTDIQGWDQDWYIDSKSTELSFRKAPHMRMIVPRDQVEWMLSLTGGTVQISQNRPPHGTGPVLSRALALAAGVMAIAVFVFALATGLPITKQGMAKHSASMQQAGEP